MTGSARPVSVLVCDDQPLVRVGYATIFAAQPGLHVVGEAADGPAAIRAADQLRPDVVVMDLHMPGMDGIEATRRLAGPEAAAPAKVLVVTTFHTDEYVYEALRAGASGFLLKDSTPGQLVEGVFTVAAGESLLSPAVTRRLIGRYADRIRPVPPGTAQGAGAARGLGTPPGLAAASGQVPAAGRAASPAGPTPAPTRWAC